MKNLLTVFFTTLITINSAFATDGQQTFGQVPTTRKLGPQSYDLNSLPAFSSLLSVGSANSAFKPYSQLMDPRERTLLSHMRTNNAVDQLAGQMGSFDLQNP